MNSPVKSLLICTNGSPDSAPAVEYGIWLAELLGIPASLLGIIEHEKMRLAVEKSLQGATSWLAEHNLPHEIRMEPGQAMQVICRLADARQHLVVAGPLGHLIWLRWLRGRSFRRIMQEIPAPLIYVPELHKKMDKILVCMGGLDYAASVEEHAIYLAGHARASLVILHIVERIYYDYPTASQIQTNWEDILQTDTPQGHSLRRALQIAGEAGIPAEVKIRHGDIIHEIFSEVSRGGYDLLAMGSPKSSHSLRHLYTPNVTAEIAEAVSVPVLTAPAGYPVIFE
jgi:nucleotide-binding universal stress UspA family protein